MPPAPAPQPPSATAGVGAGGTSPGTASGGSTGGSTGSPPGTRNPNTPTSGAQQGGGQQQAGGNTMTPRRILGWLTLVILLAAGIVAAAIYFGGAFAGCGKTPPAPPPIPSGTSAPPPSVILTPGDTADFCASTPMPLRWVLVGPDLGSAGTMVIPICANPIFEGKADRRITPDGKILRLADGESSTATYVGPPAGPGASGWPTLRRQFPGKTVALGRYKGELVRLGEDTLIVMLPPSGGEPYKDECSSWLGTDKMPAEDLSWLREVWVRCNTGTPRQRIIGRQLARSCSDSSCASGYDLAATNAAVKKIEDRLDNLPPPAPPAPIPPQQTDFDPAAGRTP